MRRENPVSPGEDVHSAGRRIESPVAAVLRALPVIQAAAQTQGKHRIPTRGASWKRPRSTHPTRPRCGESWLGARAWAPGGKEVHTTGRRAGLPLRLLYADPGENPECLRSVAGVRSVWSGWSPYSGWFAGDTG